MTPHPLAIHYIGRRLDADTILMRCRYSASVDIPLTISDILGTRCPVCGMHLVASQVVSVTESGTPQPKDV